MSEGGICKFVGRIKDRGGGDFKVKKLVFQTEKSEMFLGILLFFKCRK